MRFLFILCLMTALTGCYRMPQEGDYSEIPCTNNRDITGEKGSSLLPGIGY